MAEPLRILVAGLPAPIVREMGLRLSGVVVSDFEHSQQMGRAASQGDAKLVILSDALPLEDSIYVVRRARDASESVRIAYCISMAQAELTIGALREITVDRFFLTPVDTEEMLRELAKLAGTQVLAREASHAHDIVASILEAWDRARTPALNQIDKLDDAAIALLDDKLTPELKSASQATANALSDIAGRFGFPKGASVASEIADRLSSTNLTPVDGVSISGQLLLLRQHLSGTPEPPPPTPTPGAVTRYTPPDELDVQSFKVLAVDDEAAITRGLTAMLARRKIPVTALNDPLRFWSVIDETKPNLVLLDLEMPRISGTELCRAIRNDRRWSGLPVIFLTGHTDQESVKRIFEAGADDYVGKPFVPAELVMRIESRLTGVKARRIPIETDPVTGLATAGKVTDVVQRFLRLARRKSDPYSFGVLEVDDFATIIQTYGRRAGEMLLRAIGELLQKSFRGEDVVGWWSGAEFSIGMYGSPKDQSAIKLERVCGQVAELTITSDAGASIQARCSGGVAQYKVDGEDIPSMREGALNALHAIRIAGVARVGISGVKPTGPMTRRVDVAIVDDDSALLSLLQHAMESRSLSVATFRDGESAAEALTSSVPEVQASVILLGVDIPGLNGLEVLRRLNSAQVTRVSKVVMVTARTGERDILAALELGAIDHIAKPFSVPVLVHKVRVALRQNQTW
ncbi:MAG TPA: response regulator [Gemmatimonadaceae bacterium]